MRSLVSSLALGLGVIVCAVAPSTSSSAADDSPIGILLAAGDISSGEFPNCDAKDWYRYADKTGDIIKKTVDAAQSAQPPVPVKVLALGDIAYGEGTDEQFKCFADRWNDKDLDKGEDETILPVPGNHEYLSPDHDAAPYFEHFKDNTFVTQKGDHKGYFALNFPRPDGPWRLIGLNADIARNQSKQTRKQAMADQMDWLVKALGQPDTQQPCVLAFWHEPMFSSGQHGHENYSTPKPGAALATDRSMQNALQILYDHGASVVLNGHDHDYEQFAPHDAKGKAAADGFRSFVVGTGGANLTHDDYIKLAPNSEGGPFGMSKGIQGVLKITLYEHRFEWDFLPIDDSKKFPLAMTKADCVARKVPQQP